MPDLNSLPTLQAIQENLLNGKFTMINLVEAYLRNIDTYSELNIYVEVFSEEVRSKAERIQHKIFKDKRSLGNLFGLVISIKDVICFQGHRVTASSKILQGFESQYTATALQKLLDEDAIVIGRTNCDEFAMGSSNENSFYGPVRNGDDPSRVPGGSSGGAAVSVQMRTCHVALGSDTGGSVRQPASFCGLSALKPTYGRISRFGLIAYGSSFDQIGIVACCVEDIARMLQFMAGFDPADNTSSDWPVDQYTSMTYSEKGRYAIFKGLLDHKMLNPEISRRCRRLIDQLREAGQIVNEIEFPYTDYLVPCYYVLTTAEASSNLGRYDGVRYGFRSKNADEIIELYQKTRTEGFGKEVKRRIMMGTFVLSAGYYDAYYTKAQQVRRLISDSLNKIFSEYDYIIMPASTDVAWPLGKYKADPVEMYLSDVFTVLANLAGSPAISLPCGKTKEGLFYGIQIIGNKFSEKKLLAAAGYIENLA